MVSCGSDSEDKACTPGEPKACVVAGQQCLAVQICDADGAAFGDCACPSAGGTAGSAGAGGSGSSSNSAGGAAGSGAIVDGPLYDAVDRVMGAPCATDADCPAAPDGSLPLNCITSTSTTEFATGGPQDGYCTAPCQATDDCQALDGLSACSGAGYCIGLCQPGNGVNAVKCLASRAQSCIANPMNPDIGACLPMCESDAGCGTGQFCDLGKTGFGLCTTTAPVGGDIGAPCTTATEAADCKSGLCLTYQDASNNPVASFCSASCTFGSLAGCGFADTISVPREAVCAQSQAEDGGYGDIGLCFELCDVDTDCAQAGWTCEDDLTDDGKITVGRAGICRPPSIDVPSSDAGAL
jgi:hypothetical protein